MNLFLDSSAMAMRYIAEEGSEEVDVLLVEADALALSVLCLPEIISALCRRVREKSLTAKEYAQAKQAIEADFADATVVQLTHEVISLALALLERSSLRSSDALQVASAVVWGADRFVSADARQCAAAKGAGLRVTQVG